MGLKTTTYIKMVGSKSNLIKALEIMKYLAIECSTNLGEQLQNGGNCLSNIKVCTSRYFKLSESICLSDISDTADFVKDMKGRSLTFDAYGPLIEDLSLFYNMSLYDDIANLLGNTEKSLRFSGCTYCEDDRLRKSVFASYKNGKIGYLADEEYNYAFDDEDNCDLGFDDEDDYDIVFDDEDDYDINQF